MVYPQSVTLRAVTAAVEWVERVPYAWCTCILLAVKEMNLSGSTKSYLVGGIRTLHRGYSQSGTLRAVTAVSVG